MSKKKDDEWLDVVEEVGPVTRPATEHPPATQPAAPAAPTVEEFLAAELDAVHDTLYSALSTLYGHRPQPKRAIDILHAAVLRVANVGQRVAQLRDQKGGPQ